MKLYVSDLAAVAGVYAPPVGDEGEGRRPELYVRLGKGGIPAVGDDVTLSNSRTSALPSVECEGEVVAIAVIVKPKWQTLRNPRDEREQMTL